ncbi:MAG TPA: tape measure protein [Enteractinococcus sp.]
MARERSIVVRLRAEISDYKNKMGQASRSLSDFEKSQQKMGGAAETTMGRLVQSARINEAEWTNVGQTLAVVGGSITGLGLAALKSGVQYNTLQQTTRAALTTIFQDGAKANAQMDALDDFARNSPFAKQVFIEAQQQMLGFGIEAQKVLPYLDSIQNAVAATGGSNQDIAELATVFSQVHANAKITARELMMFGQRGVDAATIIGSQMGKTGAEIREEITDGTLDAGEALDALAAGMDERFGGAAANVKETFDGAWDRIKAAWRDLSSTLATPLVDPDGGGALIDFLNGVADAMRQFIAAPTWLQGTVAAIAGLTGLVALGGGTLLMAAPKYYKFKEDLQTLANVYPWVGKLSGALGKLGRAAAIGAVVTTASVGLVKLADALSDSGVPANANRITAALAGINDLDINTVFLDATAGAYDLNDAMERLADLPFGHEWGMDVADTLGVTSNASLNAKKTFEELDATLSGLVDGGQTDRAAQLYEALSGSIDTTRFSVEELDAYLPNYYESLDAADAEQKLTAESADELSGSLDGTAMSAEEAQDAMDEWIKTVSEAGASFGSIIDAFDAVIEKQDGVKHSSAQTMEQWIDQMQKQAEATANWRDNTIEAFEQINEEVPTSAQKAHEAFVKEMVAAGEGGAEALQTFVDGTPEQRAQLVEAWESTGPMINDVIGEGLEPISVDVDPEKAEEKVNEILAWIGEKTADPLKVGADTSGAESDVNLILRHWAGTTTDTNVGANIQPADTTARDLFGKWSRTTTDTNVDANKNPAENTVQGMLNKWTRTTTDTNVDANTNPASSAFSGVTGHWARTTTTTKIDADTSPARSAWQSFKDSVGTIWTTIRTAVTGNYEGGPIAAPGRYQGGQILPGRKAGGWVPGQRAGYDNILWPLHAGGQTLMQPLEGREFVVRSSQAHRYTPELYAMNNGSFPTGMMERLYSTSAAGPMTVVQQSTGPVELSAGSIQALARAVQPFLVVDNHVIAQANGSDARQATLAGRY